MKKSGFTLAEVLIALVIIGVIAAMTIPTLMNKITRNDISKAKNNSLPKRDFSSEIIKRDMESRTALRLT